MKASGHIEPYIFHPHGGGKAKLTWAVYVNGQRTGGYLDAQVQGSRGTEARAADSEEAVTMREPESLEEQAAMEAASDADVFTPPGIKLLWDWLDALEEYEETPEGGAEMKTATQVADGFRREHRKRAHCLREKAYKEGFQSCLAIVGGMLTARDVDDSDLIQAITIWIKEMKETNHE